MRDVFFIAFLAGTLLMTFRYPFAALLLWAWFTLATPQAATFWVGQFQLNVLIAAVTFVAFFLHGEFTRMRLTAIVWLMLFFTFWLWIAQLNSLEPAYSAIHFDRFLKIMIFVILCAVSIQSRLRFHALLWMLVLVMGFYGAKGGAYTILTLGQSRYFGLENTILFDNNHLGIALAAILPMFLYCIRQSAIPAVRLGTWFVFVMSIIAIIGTQSRGALLSLIAFVGLMWWRSKKKLTTGSIVIICALLTLQFVPDEWTNRMETIAEAGEDASFQGRIDAWVINWQLALENPITGVGHRVSYIQDIADAVSNRKARAAHSIYFEVLGGSGFIGLLIFLALLSTAYFKAGAAQKLYANNIDGSWRVPFGRYAQMSLIIFGVGGASVSMEMWEGYLIIIALISALPHINTAVSTADVSFEASKVKKHRPTNFRDKVKAKLPKPDQRRDE